MHQSLSFDGQEPLIKVENPPRVDEVSIVPHNKWPGRQAVEVGLWADLGKMEQAREGLQSLEEASCQVL